MTLSERLREYIAACFTGIWIESHEHTDALAEIAQLCRDENWNFGAWDIEAGLQIPGQAVDDANSSSDPLAAIRSLSVMATPDGTAILVLQNFHRFTQSAEIVQALARQIIAGKQNRTFVVVLAPVVQIPIELEKLFVVIEHDLPSREQLAEIGRTIATEEGELPAGSELETVLDAAAGLTRYEAEGAFALSLVRSERITPEAIWSIKSQQLKKSGLLSLHRGGESFDALGGLSALKTFCLRAMRKQGSRDPLRRPRGVMLLSPPGCGKSCFAKALGNETGRPTLVLDIGSLMGSLVGSTEANVRQALRIIDAMAPCVVLLDEVDKALAGVSSSGQSDSGVTARMFGQILTWLSDRTSDSFILCTCNDISKLPPEFARSERFDSIWYVDLPGEQEKQAIWQIYLKLFDLPEQKLPPHEKWSGAEIRSCCRLSALLDVPLISAAQNVVPVAVTAAESVERLRTWASGRCLDADQGGIYQHLAKPGVRRRVKRSSIDPSQN